MKQIEVDLFRAVGGEKACIALAEAFYARVPQDPVLRKVYGSSNHCAIENLGVFLVQFLGGPMEYSNRRWSLSLREAHARFKVGSAERQAWLENMAAAAEAVGIDERIRKALGEFFEIASAGLVNTTEVAPALISEPDSPRCPHATSLPEEIERRGEEFRAIERAVAAVRAGETSKALTLATSPLLQSYFERDRGALLSLLAIMSGSGSAELTSFVLETVSKAPELARLKYTYGRTLLHEATSEGSVPLVELLLKLDADPNAVDKFGHPPLYFAGNWCTKPAAGEIVHRLIQGGANPDAQDFVKRCTALHMAARRGNLAVAEALLDGGANLEIPDIAGETPLRRAVNCGKTAVAALLLDRGANIRSMGSKGLAVWEAARSSAMKELVGKYAAKA